MKIKFCFGLFLLLPFLMACGGGDEPNLPDEPQVKDKSLVLIYLAADNNLKKFAEEDYEELKAGFLDMEDTDDMFLLVYMDMGDSPQLVELKKEQGTVVESFVKQYEDRNSCGMKETQEVFDEVFKNPLYQAGNYGLVYWSHGEGWLPAPGTKTRWVGQDTGNGTHYMNIDDLAAVLDGAPHFDFILFDACFMQSIEVAYELRNYTDYYIGSPTENPGPGAPYDKILPYMFRKGAATQIASAYYDAYFEKYNGGVGISNSNWTGGTAISVLKSSELEALAKATATALSGVQADCKLLSETIFDYDQRTRSSASHVGYYDLMELMEELVDDAAALQTWKSAYNSALTCWKTTPKVYSMNPGMFSMERANGVTHYIPVSSKASANEAYRRMEWYQAAGLSSIGF